MPVRLSVKTVGADLVRRGLEDLGAEIPKIGTQRIYLVMLRARTRLRKPGARPTYPIRWDSEKQRRAYFATDGFGRGIPYRRSGRYPKGWELAKLPNGYRIENNTPAARYIGGDYSGQGQSQIHMGRWPLFQEVVEDEIQELPPDIEQAITYYARGRGF